MQDATEMTCEMYATKDNGAHIINVSIDTSNSTYGAVQEETAYLQSMLNSLPAAMTQAGYLVQRAELSTVFFAGEERHCICMDYGYNGVILHQVLIAIRFETNMATIALTSAGDNLTEEMMATFYPLQK